MLNKICMFIVLLCLITSCTHRSKSTLLDSMLLELEERNYEEINSTHYSY